MLKSRQGTVRFTYFLAVLLALVSSRIDADYFKESFAVIIGVDEYPMSDFENLSYAKRDAEAMAQYLRSSGYRVTSLFDSEATKLNIISELNSVAKVLSDRDRVLVFFAGHGYTERLAGTDWGYIVPYDGTGNPATYISMDEMLTESGKMADARHQLFIMDACYGGILGTRRGGLANSSRGTRPLYSSTQGFISEITSRKARQIITAGGAHERVVDGGPFGHSLFTGYLLKALEEGVADENHDGYVTFLELSSYLLSAASNERQTPVADNLRGHEGGQYVFETPLSPGKKRELSPEEKREFKTAILGIVGKLRLNQQLNPLSVVVQVSQYKGTLEKLVTECQKDSAYEKEMPSEVAVVYRLYGVSTLLYAMNSGLPLDYYIKETNRYSEKSFDLDPHLWEKEHERSSYEFFKKLSRSDEDPRLDDFYSAIYSMVMIYTADSEVRKGVQPLLAYMHERGKVLLGKPKADFEFFRDFQTKKNDMTYGQWISFIRTTVMAIGGSSEGPVYEPAEDGKTLIRYDASFGGRSYIYEWLVDGNNASIGPMTKAARDLHDFAILDKQIDASSSLFELLAAFKKQSDVKE